MLVENLSLVLVFVGRRENLLLVAKPQRHGQASLRRARERAARRRLCKKHRPKPSITLLEGPGLDRWHTIAQRAREREREREGERDWEIDRMKLRFRDVVVRERQQEAEREIDG